MAVEYRLTMAGKIPLDQVAESMMPDPTNRPTPTDKPGLLSADLLDRQGFTLIVRHGRNGYYEADDNGTIWEWEPDIYVNVTFRMAKEGDVDAGVRNMLTAVSRLLTSHTEDAALILNGDALLLTRFGDTLRKHSRTVWWDHYDFVDDVISG
ncbi:SitI3 family protein [Plantactinospora sp. CA-290183]|uniref:SitI3 family protein n=1 Tax=Plantactinospora sp. CA-290183 TaxID=3240006 RepID=UPI003D8DA200